jgi:peptidoglycan/LPS O-acetylase OafA/YrhL
VLAPLLYVLPRLTPLRSAQELAPWAWTYTSNVLLGWKGTSAAPTHFHHLWSLAIEEQFYLLWPPIVLLCGRRRLMQICWGCIALAWLARAGLDEAGLPFASYVFTPARMDTLAFGAFLAMVARGPRGLGAMARWVVPVSAVAVAVLAAIAFARGGLATRDPIMHAFGFPALVALFGMMLVAAVTAPAGGWTARILGARPLRFLGKYSYALYLFHYPVIVLLSKKGLAAWRLAGPGESTIPAQLLVMAVAFGVTLAVSLASWRLLEQPFLRLKRFFPYRAA